MSLSELLITGYTAGFKYVEDVRAGTQPDVAAFVSSIEQLRAVDMSLSLSPLTVLEVAGISYPAEVHEWAREGYMHLVIRKMHETRTCLNKLEQHARGERRNAPDDYCTDAKTFQEFAQKAGIDLTDDLTALSAELMERFEKLPEVSGNREFSRWMLHSYARSISNFVEK